MPHEIRPSDQYNTTDSRGVLLFARTPSDTLIPLLVDANGNIIVSGVATQTTLAALLTELQAKADLLETQPVSIAATVQVDVADEATRDLGKVDIASLDQYTPVTGRLPVDGSGVTQPVSGPLTDTQLRATAVPVSGTVTASGPLTDTQLRASAVPVSAATLPLPTGATTETTLAAIRTAVELIDNFIFGQRGLVTEDSAMGIKIAVETIDNFISGARGLVTEDNSAAIKTAVELIDNFISGARGLVTEDNSAAIKTAVELLDNIVAGSEAQVDIVTLPTSGGKTVTYVSVNQGAAGTTVLAAASAGNRHKFLGGFLTMSLVGTLKFTDGEGDLSGPTDPATNGGFVWPPTGFPYLQTAVNSALNFVTTLGAARGALVILTEA